MADGARVAPAQEAPPKKAEAEQHEQCHHAAAHAAAAAAAASRQGERLLGREACRDFEARWRAGAGAHGGAVRAARMPLHVGGRRQGGLWRAVAGCGGLLGAVASCVGAVGGCGALWGAVWGLWGRCMRLYVVERHVGLELTEASVDDAQPGAHSIALRAMHLGRGKPLWLVRGLVYLASVGIGV